MYASDQVRKKVELIGIKELALAGKPFISNYYKENDSTFEALVSKDYFTDNMEQVRS